MANVNKKRMAPYTDAIRFKNGHIYKCPFCSYPEKNYFFGVSWFTGVVFVVAAGFT